MPISIENISSSNLKDFVLRYKAWHQAQLLHGSHQSAIDFSQQSPKIKCFNDRDLDAINACRDSVVIIDSLNEGLHTLDVYRYFDKNKHYLIFMPWFDQNRIQLSISYTPIWYSHLLFDMVDDYFDAKSWYYYVPRNYEFNYPKPCLLTAMVGPRSHRNTIRDVLVSALPHDAFVYRVEGKDYGRDISTVDVVKIDTQAEEDFATQVVKKFQHVDKMPDYVYWKLLSMPAYNLSYFHLVMESDVGRPVFFLTEKTVKPLLSAQPFVMYTSQGFLQYLRRLGFQTFDQCWDESYDQEPDFMTRAKLVAELCVQLQNFDWAGNKNKLQAICQHNYQVITNLTAVAATEFENFDKVIENLHNFSSDVKP